MVERLLWDFVTFLEGHLVNYLKVWVCQKRDMVVGVVVGVVI